MRLSNTFNFGKHRYETLQQVIKDDPQYIHWLLKEDIIEISPKAYKLYKKHLRAWEEERLMDLQMGGWPDIF